MSSGSIYYGMLNPYESSILSLRPLHRGSVYRLWKSTLIRFLIGNGVQCHHISDKNILVDMVFEMMQGEQQDHMESQDSHLAVSFNVPDHHLAGNMPSMTITYSTTPENIYEQEDPLEQCDCHECQQFEAPIPPPYDLNDILHPCPANNRGSLSVFDQSNSDDDDYFVDSNFCSCTVHVDTLLTEHEDFPADSRQTIVSMVNTPVEQLAEFLESFGVEIPGGSRCRIYLMMLLRDLLDEQKRALSQGVASAMPANMGEASGSSSQQAGFAGLDRMTQAFSRMMANKLSMEGNKNPGNAPDGEEDKSRECGICLQNPRQIAFVPCGHAICCIECARKLHACPVCRRKVHRRLRLYFS